MSPLPADKVRVNNVAVGGLADKITYNQTSFDVVGDLTGWPTSDFEIAIDDELIHVGTRDGATLSDLTRGYEGTNDNHHNKQAEVSYVKTGAELASPAPGGGSMPVQAIYEGDAVTVPDGGNALMTWDTLEDGTDLLDRSTPDTPVVLADGLYAITAYPGQMALSAGGWAEARLPIYDDPAFDNLLANYYNTIFAPPGGGSMYWPSFSFVRNLQAQNVLQLSVINHDGAQGVVTSLAYAVMVKLA